MTTAVTLMVERMTPKQREEWEERAALMEYEGGLSREQAEEEAAWSVMRGQQTSMEF